MDDNDKTNDAGRGDRQNWRDRLGLNSDTPRAPVDTRSLPKLGGAFGGAVERPAAPEAPTDRPAPLRRFEPRPPVFDRQGRPGDNAPSSQPPQRPASLGTPHGAPPPPASERAPASNAPRQPTIGPALRRDPALERSAPPARPAPAAQASERHEPTVAESQSSQPQMRPTPGAQPQPQGGRPQQPQPPAGDARIAQRSAPVAPTADGGQPRLHPELRPALTGRGEPELRVGTVPGQREPSRAPRPDIERVLDSRRGLDMGNVRQATPEVRPASEPALQVEAPTDQDGGRPISLGRSDFARYKPQAKSAEAYSTSLGDAAPNEPSDASLAGVVGHGSSIAAASRGAAQMRAPGALTARVTGDEPPVAATGEEGVTRSAPKTFEELVERSKREPKAPQPRRPATGAPVDWPIPSRGPAARVLQQEDHPESHVADRSDVAAEGAFRDEPDFSGRAPSLDDGYRGAHSRELDFVEQDDEADDERPSTGRRASAVEYQEAYRDYESRSNPQPFLAGRMPFYIGGAVVGLVAVVGLAFYLFSGPSGSLAISDTPPIIAAPSEPAKSQPEEGTNQPVVPRQSKLIYDRILGDGQSGGEERLVPRQEEPLTPGLGDGPAPNALPPAVPPPPTGGQSSLPADATINAASANAGEGDDALPIPGQIPVASNGDAARPNAPLPRIKPAAPASSGSASVVQASGAQQVALATNPATASGQYLVQLASFRTQQDATNEFAKLKQNFPRLLTNLSPFIQEADLGTRGKFYRLRIGPVASQDNASQLCNSLIASGVSDCLVRRQ